MRERRHLHDSDHESKLTKIDKHEKQEIVKLYVLSLVLIMYNNFIFSILNNYKNYFLNIKHSHEGPSSDLEQKIQAFQVKRAHRLIKLVQEGP